VSTKRLTIDDIARLAGVSKATISRVLNNKPDVDPETRARILRLMAEQNFVPNATAANLAGGRSNLVGMMVRSDTWLYALEIMRAVSELLDATSYELVLYRINAQLSRDKDVTTIDRPLSGNLTSGLISIFPGQTTPQLAPFSHQDLPLVVIDDQYRLAETPWTGTPIPWITADNQSGAYEATKHLIGHGHQRIAHIGGLPSFQCTHERYAGYQQALAEANIELDPSLVVKGSFNPSGGRAAAQQLLSLPMDQRPTAIFAASDTMAYGVFTVATELGIRIPDDIAIVGFDDLAAATADLFYMPQVYPSLTTIRQPFYEMGRYATELLLSQIENTRATKDWAGRWYTPKSVSTPVGLVQTNLGGVFYLQLPTQLVIRSSCGCLATASEPEHPSHDTVPA
jgi:LacI family transcriptional regulator